VPSIFGYFLLKANNEDPATSTSYIGLGVTIIAFICLMIGILFMSVLTESLSAVFIFFCFDKKFTSLGVQPSRSVP
jgi:hypothetical protein